MDECQQIAAAITANSPDERNPQVSGTVFAGAT